MCTTNVSHNPPTTSRYVFLSPSSDNYVSGVTVSRMRLPIKQDNRPVVNVRNVCSGYIS
jgi:hypothetical protein